MATENSAQLVFVTGTPQMWGAEKSLLSVAAGIARSTGRSVALITSNAELCRAWREQVNDDAELLEASPSRLRRNLGFWRSVGALLAADCTVVLFDHYLLPVFAVRGRRRRARLAVDVHDSVKTNPRRRPFFWLMGRVADKAICVSDYIADQVSPRLSPAVVHRPIPNLGVARNDFSPNLRVGIVGQVSPHKSVLEAVDIVAAVSDGSMLVIRGTAPLGGEEYLGRVLERGEDVLGERLRYDGYVATENAFDNLDVLLFLNADEPSGRVIAEAQMASVVPIVPAVGGASEFVSKHSGLSFSSSLDAVRTIRRLAENTELRQELAQTAREHALEKYSVAEQSRKYVEALEGVPGGPGRILRSGGPA